MEGVGGEAVCRSMREEGSSEGVRVVGRVDGIGRKRDGVLQGVGRGKGGMWQMVGRVYVDEL